MNKLNLGCGTDIRRGWTNVDAVSLPGVDVVHDLTYLPLPFPSASCDEIVCQDVLEHLDYIPLLREAHRLLVVGGKLHVRVPHFTSIYAFGDPTHRHFFAVETLKFFVKDHERDYYFDFAFSEITVRLLFSKRVGRFWNYLVEPFANFNSRTAHFYEDTPLRIFPALNIGATLVK